MGGVEKILCQYIMGLKKNVLCEITVFSQKKVTEKYFLDFFKMHEVKLVDDVFEKKPGLFSKLFHSFNKYCKCYRLFNSYDVIIDFANFAFHKELPLVNKPKFGWCHGSIMFFDNLMQDSRLAKNIKQYDKIVCLSDSFLIDFKSKYPELSNKIVRIYNPIDVERLDKEAKENLFETVKPYFVAVQRLDYCDKDIETIINAFNEFSLSNDKYKLYIVGDGPSKERLMKLSEQNKNIVFCGQLNNASQIIKNAEALILSSTTKWGEGFAVTLVEAQSLKTLTISSNVKSGPAEILLDGKAGILFEPCNVSQLAVIMNDVVSKNIDTESIVKTAFDNIVRFKPENSISAIKNLFEESRR